MREQIFQPLGMNDTGAESSTEENPEHVGEPEEDAPLLTLVREVILQPLGLGATAKSATESCDVLQPEVRRESRPRVHDAPHNLSCYAGSMAFFSTPSDLVRFALSINSDRLLQPATVQLLQTSQQLTWYGSRSWLGSQDRHPRR